jgi:sulfide:quinone oxidoreductase
VTTTEATYDADFLVIALGADYDLAATPGFVEGGFEYDSVDSAERLRDELPSFRGGKVLLAVLSIPFKCPPAPCRGSWCCTTTWSSGRSATRLNCM